MPQIVSNLPWLVIWVVVFLVQSYFFRKKNSFGSLILLWLTLLVGTRPSVRWYRGFLRCGFLEPKFGFSFSLWRCGTT